MKLKSAKFVFDVHKVGRVIVTFADDEIAVVIGNDSFLIENKEKGYGGRPYKPCLSHCRQAIEHAMRKPPSTPWAKQKRKVAKPVLGLVGGQE
jgi:hypothetical protein